MSSIDLGPNPVGNPPSPEQQEQIRSAIGVPPIGTAGAAVFGAETEQEAREALNVPGLNEDGGIDAILKVRAGTAAELADVLLLADEVAIEKDAAGNPASLRFGDGVTLGGVPSQQVVFADEVELIEGGTTNTLLEDSKLFLNLTAGRYTIELNLLYAIAEDAEVSAINHALLYLTNPDNVISAITQRFYFSDFGPSVFLDTFPAFTSGSAGRATLYSSALQSLGADFIYNLRVSIILNLSGDAELRVGARRGTLASPSNIGDLLRFAGSFIKATRIP